MLDSLENAGLPSVVEAGVSVTIGAVTVMYKMEQPSSEVERLLNTPAACKISEVMSEP